MSKDGDKMKHSKQEVSEDKGVKKDPSVFRCQNLAILEMREEVADYYADLQADYRHYLPLMILWGQNGFMEPDETGLNFSAVLPSTAKTRCENRYGAQIAADLKLIADDLPSSLYAIFTNDYQPLTGVKKVGDRWKFVTSLNTVSDEEFAKKVKPLLRDYKGVTEEQWRRFREERVAGKTADQVWDDLDSILRNPTLAALKKIHDKHMFRVKRPESKLYCDALAHMLSSSYDSWKKINEARQLELQAMRDEQQGLLANKTTNSLYNLVCEFADELESQNYGLTRRIFFIARKEWEDEKSHYLPVIKLLVTEKYLPLLQADNKTVSPAVKAWDICSTLKQRSPYIRFVPPTKDYPIPFGQTGRGHKFTLKEEAGKVCFLVPGLTKDEMPLSGSHYFSSLRIDKVGTDFKISFRHKTKIRSKKSARVTVKQPRINGTVTEVGILRRNGKFFLRVAYKIAYPQHNIDLKSYFASAAPSTQKLELLPAQMRVAGVDLNISDPIVVSKADIFKGEDGGPLSVLDYGSGKVVGEPVIICKDTSRAGKISSLATKCRTLRDVIRNFRHSLHQGTPLPSKSLEFLQEVPVAQEDLKSPSPRYLIQTWIKYIRTEMKRLHYKVWLDGYCHTSEAMRMLDLVDQVAFLMKSYENIHVKPGHKIPKKTTASLKIRETSRTRFRLHVSRLVGARVVRACEDCQMIFLEDLSTGFSEGSNNSLARLFSAGQLKNSIVMAAEKVGKAVVFVCKDGTSIKDPVFGLHGLRPSKKTPGIPPDKKRLYVRRDGKIGYINADQAASLNVLLVGLSHSVAKYKFFVKDGKLQDDEEVAAQQGKKPRKIGVRLERLLKMNFDTPARLFFSLEKDQVVPCYEATETPYTGWVYVYHDRLLTTRQRDQQVNQLAQEVKDLLRDGVKIPKWDVIPDCDNSCLGFSPCLVLDDETAAVSVV